MAFVHEVCVSTSCNKIFLIPAACIQNVTGTLKISNKRSECCFKMPPLWYTGWTVFTDCIHVHVQYVLFVMQALGVLK